LGRVQTFMNSLGRHSWLAKLIMTPSFATNANSLNPSGVTLFNRPMWLHSVTSCLSHMLFQGFPLWEFSLHLEFNIAMPEIAKRPLRSTIRLALRWSTMIFSQPHKLPAKWWALAPFSRTFFLCDRVLGLWAQFLGAFAISRFDGKICFSWETSDSRNLEIGLLHFGASGCGCACRWESQNTDPRNRQCQINGPLPLAIRRPRSNLDCGTSSHRHYG